MLGKRGRFYEKAPRPNVSDENARMTAVFDDRQQIEAAKPYSEPARRSTMGNWFADQLPKAALALGLVVTVAWVAVLAWFLNLVLNLF